MQREYLSQLIQRSLDGALSPAEREELSRALRDDALLRTEADEMRAVHASTEALFRQLALPSDFSTRVMKRVQAQDVPADANHISTRLRARRLAPRRSAVAPGVYWVGALAAAAIVALTVALVVQLSGRDVPNNKTGPSLAGESSGVPGTGEGNRTDSPNSPSGNREASGPKPEASQPDPLPALPETAPEEVRQPEGPQPQPKPEGTEPAREGGGTVETPAKAPSESPEKGPETPAETPKGTVEDNPTPTEPERKTTAEPKPEVAPESLVLARLSILGGKAELLGTDGKWKALNNDEELKAGMQIRTNANGNASLVFADGTVTLAKGSTVTLTALDRVTLDSGTVALDRPNARDGESLAVACDAYTVYLMHGTGMVRRKARGMEYQHFVGLGTITHDELGSMIFDEAAQYDLEFGKEYPPVKPSGLVVAPDWVAEARTSGLLALIEPKLTERFADAPRERREIDKNLPRALRRLMVYPLDQASVLEFLTRALDNYKLDAATVVRMVAEVETAIVESKDVVPNTIAYNAARSAMLGTVKDFTTWRDTFLRLVRGETTRPPQASVPRKTEVIEAGKFRKVVPPPTPTPKPEPKAEPKPEAEPEKTPEQPSK